MDIKRRTNIRAILWLTFGLAGWTEILLSALSPSTAHTLWFGAILFLIIASGVRALAFPLRGAAKVSLDAAIFVAAVACLGVGITAVGVGILISGDALTRGLRRRRRIHRTLVATLLHSFYFGGLSGGLVAVWATLFHVEPFQSATNLWRVPLLGVVFLVTHYLIQTIERFAGGEPLAQTLKRNALGACLEAMLLPLGSAIVVIWDPSHLGPFALLGGTYLLINFAFNRLAQLTSALRRRVRELEAMNRIAKVLGRSLDTGDILSSLLIETASALPLASQVEVALTRDAPIRSHFYDAKRRQGGWVELPEAPPWLSIASPKLSDNIEDFTRPLVRSTVAVPLTMHGEQIGVLAAESAVRGAFGSDSLRLLTGIAAQTAAAVENARLYTLANVDGLTGLYCRRYFDVRVAEEIERARRFGTSFALIMLDLDDFKKLNDTHGHLVGDRALREVANLATRQLRGVDLAARYGGEELAFLLPRTTLTDAHAVAERIREALATHWFVERGRRLRITASLGVAGWAESNAAAPGTTNDPRGLLARADEALYRAKAMGKNCVQIDLANFELTPSLGPIRQATS